MLVREKVKGSIPDSEITRVHYDYDHSDNSGHTRRETKFLRLEKSPDHFRSYAYNPHLNQFHE